MRTHRGGDEQNAFCLNLKAELPLNGDLAFLLEEGGMNIDMFLNLFFLTSSGGG